MNRVCFFVHFNENNIVDEYVIYYLKGLKSVVNKIVFISNSQLGEVDKNEISQYSDDIIERENIGYDFMAWQTGIENVGYDNLCNYDEIVIANDSCYAPLFNFSEMFLEMSSRECDFWGATDSKMIDYHVQSYFMVFKHNILKSDIFTKFWQGIELEKNKHDVIEKYEIGLSSILIKNGFRALAYDSLGYFSTRNDKIKEYQKRYRGRFSKMMLRLFFLLVYFRAESVDKGILRWDKLINNRFPFLKKKLIKTNDPDISVVSIESVKKVFDDSNSDYPIRLIKE